MNKTILKQIMSELGKKGAKKLKDSLSPEDYQKLMSERGKAGMKKRWSKKEQTS